MIRYTGPILTGLIWSLLSSGSAAQEAPIGRIALGFGYNRDVGMSLVGSVQHRDFLGWDQAIDLAFSVSSQDHRILLDYRLQGLGRGNPSFGVWASHVARDRSARLGVETSVSRLAPMAVWNLGHTGVASIGPVFIHDELRASAVAPLVLEAEVGSRSLLGLSLQADVLMRNIGIGFSASVLNDGEGLRYSRSEFFLDYGFPISSDAISANIAFRGGAISVESGESTLNDRFIPEFGAIRGFGANGFGPVDPVALNGAPLGATRYAVVSLDARYADLLPVAPNVVVGLFVDVGSAWGLDLGNDAARAAVDADAYWRGAAGITIAREFGAARLELVLGEAFAHRPSDQVQNVQFNFYSSF